MKLNESPNLRVEDFPSQQSWIGKLFITLNPFIKGVSQLSQQNIEFSNNIKSVSKDYDITSFAEFSIKWPFVDSFPVDVRIVQASKTDQKTPTILLCAWEYSVNNKLITIKRLTEVNLDSVSALSGRYNFTVRATV